MWRNKIICFKYLMQFLVYSWCCISSYITVLINYYKVRGLNSINLLFYSNGKQKSGMSLMGLISKGQNGCFFMEAPGKNSFLAHPSFGSCQHSLAYGHITPISASEIICLILFSVVLSSSTPLFYGLIVTAFMALLDNSG